MHAGIDELISGWHHMGVSLEESGSHVIELHVDSWVPHLDTTALVFGPRSFLVADRTPPLALKKTLRGRSKL